MQLNKRDVLQRLPPNGMACNPETCQEHIDWSGTQHGGGNQDDDENYDDNEDDRQDDDAVSRSLVFNTSTRLYDQRMPLSFCYFDIFAMMVADTVGYLKFPVELDNDLT